MFKFFKTLVSWRRFIIVSGIVGAISMAIVSFVMPQWYRAHTSIFPPESNSSTAMYAELLQSLSMPLLGGLGGGAAPETIYIDMLKSRAISEKIIEEFDLKSLYGESRIELVMGRLISRSGYSLLENGLLLITFEDKDPERAAAIANRMVELLDELNSSINMTRAARTREFVEEQIVSRKTEVAAAETSLRDFQKNEKTLQLDQQLGSALSVISDLTGEAIAIETELKIIAHYTAKTSEEYQQKQFEYEEITNQLRKLKVSDADGDRDVIRSYLPTLDEVPQLALEFARLKREVQIQNTIYIMLVKEFEKSRIEEARDTPTIHVLDKAAPPSIRSRPRRKLLVIGGGLAGFGWGAFLALFVSAWREEDENSTGFKSVLSPIANDLGKLFRRN